MEHVPAEQASPEAVAATLDTGVRSWIARIAELAPTLPALRSTNLSTRRDADRALSDSLAVEFTQPAPVGVMIDDRVVGGVAARRYRPPGLPAAAPTQLFLHGGGFVSGSIHEELNDRLLARRAAAAGLQIVSLDYRLAPEYPYPAAVDDAVAALDDLAADPDVDEQRLGIAGNSAGAAIAASALLVRRDRGSARLVHQALEVPAVALRPVGDSAARYAVGFGLDASAGLAAAYLPDPTADDGYSSPLDADLRNLPATVVLTAEHDPLRDAGELFAQRLRDAGGDVVLIRGAGHLHASCSLTAVSAASREWQDRYAAELRRAYGTEAVDAD